MKLPWKRRVPDAEASGRLRSAASTSELINRGRPGEVFVLDHRDLDASTARALLEHHPEAVINAATTMSGDQLVRGARVLLQANIPVIDAVGAQAIADLPKGKRCHIVDGDVLVGDEVVCRGTRLTLPTVEQLEASALQLRLDQVAAVGDAVEERLDIEHAMILNGDGVPDVATAMHDKVVLVVGPGLHRSEDLRRVQQFLTDHDPVLLAVGSGADALMTRRRKPHVILGTLEDVSDEALQSKAEIVLTCPAAYLAARRGLSETDDAGDSGSGQMPTGDNTSDGDLPGAGEPAPEQLPETTDNEDWAYREAATRARRAMYAQEARLTDLGVTSPVTWDVGGTAYDAALLLAHHRGARLIATVGAPNGLDDFLNRGRDGMAGDLLARTVATGRIVDGYAIERMHRPRIGNGLLIVMLLVGLLAIVAAVATTPAGQELMGLSPQWWDNLVTRTKDLL